MFVGVRMGMLTKPIPEPRRSPLVKPFVGKPPTMEELTAKLMAYAPRTYMRSEDGPYHAFKPHILDDLLPNFYKLEKFLNESGVEFDRYRALHAILCHDGLLAISPGPSGNIHSEHLAAEHYYNWLLDNGAPEEHARGVYYDVMGTNPMHDIVSKEGMILAALDIGNVGGDYHGFRRRFLNIKAESEIAMGRERTLKEVALGSLKFMPLFLRSIIEITPRARTSKGASAWHIHALSNLSRLFAEALGGREKVEHIVQVGAATNPWPGAEPLKENQLYVGIDHDKVEVENALAKVMGFQKESGGAGPAYVIPGEGNAMPVPDNFANKIIYRDVNHSVISHDEIDRVLAEKGRVHVEETRPKTEIKTKGRPSAADVIESFRKKGFRVIDSESHERMDGGYKLVFARK